MQDGCSGRVPEKGSWVGPAPRQLLLLIHLSMASLGDCAIVFTVHTSYTVHTLQSVHNIFSVHTIHTLNSIYTVHTNYNVHTIYTVHNYYNVHLFILCTLTILSTLLTLESRRGSHVGNRPSPCYIHPFAKLTPLPSLPVTSPCIISQSRSCVGLLFTLCRSYSLAL